MKVCEFDNPGQHPRELNPYWKSGGSGLPQEKVQQQSKYCQHFVYCLPVL